MFFFPIGDFDNVVPIAYIRISYQKKFNKTRTKNGFYIKVPFEYDLKRFTVYTQSVFQMSPIPEVTIFPVPEHSTQIKLG